MCATTVHHPQTNADTLTTVANIWFCEFLATATHSQFRFIADLRRDRQSCPRTSCCRRCTLTSRERLTHLRHSLGGRRRFSMCLATPEPSRTISNKIHIGSCKKYVVLARVQQLQTSSKHEPTQHPSHFSPEKQEWGLKRVSGTSAKAVSTCMHVLVRASVRC